MFGNADSATRLMSNLYTQPTSLVENQRPTLSGPLGTFPDSPLVRGLPTASELLSQLPTTARGAAGLMPGYMGFTGGQHSSTTTPPSLGTTGPFWHHLPAKYRFSSAAAALSLAPSSHANPYSSLTDVQDIHGQSKSPTDSLTLPCSTCSIPVGSTPSMSSSTMAATTYLGSTDYPWFPFTYHHDILRLDHHSILY
jgi:hypothetical protein